MKFKIAALVSSVVLVSACTSKTEVAEVQEAVIEAPTTTVFQTNLTSVPNIEILNECTPYIVLENNLLTGFTPRYFDFNMDKPIEVPKQQLNCIENVMDQYPLTLEIQGYTDGIGSQSYNQKLALRRAQSVNNELVAAGVGEEKITLVQSAKVVKDKNNDSASRRVTLTLK